MSRQRLPLTQDAWPQGNAITRIKDKQGIDAVCFPAPHPPAQGKLLDKMDIARQVCAHFGLKNSSIRGQVTSRPIFFDTCPWPQKVLSPNTSEDQSRAEFSLPESMIFKLFGKTILVVHIKVWPVFQPSTPVRLCFDIERP